LPSWARLAAAALDLGLSEVKASRLIGELESQLNQRLLQRSARAASLTALGGQYYERCKPALDQLAEAAELITARGARRRGGSSWSWGLPRRCRR
jgi:DNA-binding transcriptional LysR family regulator